MPILAWSDRFSIGMPQIDEHHQHLFFLANKFYDIFTTNPPCQDLSPLFDDLIDYVIYHFAAEEHLMQEYRYPDIAMHQKEHDDFSKRLVELDRDSHYDKKHLLIEIVVFLHDWLQTHILQSDAVFGRFVAADYNGVSRNKDILQEKV